MRAAVLKRAGFMQVEERPEPEIKENEMLIRMLVCGTCLSEYPDWKEGTEADRVLGHEPVGIVEKTGSGISRFKIGDRVTGLYKNCFAEYTVSTEDQALLVPESLSDEEAVGEPWSCLVSGASRVDVKYGDTVAIVGCGYMGLGALQLMKLKGAGKIIAVDIRRESLEQAKLFGADEVYTPDELPEKYIVDEWNDQMFIRGVDVVLEVTGGAAGLELAGKMVRPHGILSIVGFHQSGGRREIDMKLWNWKAITVINAHERRDRVQMEYMREAIVMIENKKLDAKSMMRHEYTLDEINRAFADMKEKPEGYIKGYVRIGNRRDER